MSPLPSRTPSFQIGDRVRLIYPQDGVATGIAGTVVIQFVGGLLYDVQFDGYVGTRVVDERKLVLVPRETAHGQ